MIVVNVYTVLLHCDRCGQSRYGSIVLAYVRASDIVLSVRINS